LAGGLAEFAVDDGVPRPNAIVMRTTPAVMTPVAITTAAAISRARGLPASLTGGPALKVCGRTRPTPDEV
jgi:hypothetical protein